MNIPCAHCGTCPEPPEACATIRHETPDTLRIITPLCQRIEHVGSRVTCDPAPTGTDDDYLVLASIEQRLTLETKLFQKGWVLGGSNLPDENNPSAPDIRFRSYSLGEMNLIITESPEFFRRFMAATSIAKRLNLLDKPDRIALFQAVLYGNATTVDTSRQ